MSNRSLRLHHVALFTGAVLAILALRPAVAGADPLPPPPMSLAWQLRPPAAANTVRSDTAFASYNDAAGDGFTVASTFLASYKLTPRLAPLFRIAVSRNNPSMGPIATAMSNPLLGATWTPALVSPPYKLAVFGAMTLPLGSGGGDTPDMARLAANKSAVVARSSMDNALFAVNDLAVIGGADFAYVASGLTIQAEVTLFELLRMRGSAVQPDTAKTNFTSGIHAGYFVMPWLSAGGELRYQRYLSTPKFVENDPTGTNRDTMSAAIGLRGHIKMGGKRWLRPGIAYTRGIDNPMTKLGYNVIQVDVPFTY